jgi:predicted Ser/Thr protein kinase
MDVTTICARCGRPAAGRDHLGLCPECLLAAGLGSAADATAGGAATCFTPPSPAELAPLFPQLEIEGLVGCGGMGAVYRVRQRSLERPAALKILPPDIGRDPAFAARFAREARALARLNHPNIVTLYEFGQAGELFFFLMEFVDGVSLRQVIRDGRVSPREALAIVPQLCDALQYAHDQGVVHRDIKPENILLDRLGRVKVADFGVAKLIRSSDRAGQAEPSGPPAVHPESTCASLVMGTPAYMAPEQRERPSEVDHRADIYSLGVVFYQMLTGELPGATLEPPSRKVAVDVRLDEVVLRALERTPERRYQQASEVKTMCETIAGGALAAAGTRPGAPAQPPRLLLRAAGWSALILGLALTAFTPLAVEYVDDHGLTRSARQHLAFRRQAMDELKRAREAVHAASREVADAKRRQQDAPAAERQRLFEEYEKVQAELTLRRGADAAADLRLNAAAAAKQQSEAVLAERLRIAAGLLIAAGAAALIAAQRRRAAAPGGACAEGAGRLIPIMFGLFYAGFATLVFGTATLLPERVASHFGAGGAANGWMTRSGYLAFVAAMPLAIGLLFAGLSGLVRKMPARYVNLPRKDYWLAPERRARTSVLLRGYMLALACLMTLFFGGLHVLTLDANRLQPPRLSMDGMLLVTTAFLIGLMLWIVALLMRFAEADVAPAVEPRPRAAAGRAGRRWRRKALECVAGVVIALTLRQYVVSAYTIKNDALAPELPAGSYVLAWKLARTFAPGDLVVYRDGARYMAGRVSAADGSVVEVNRNGVAAKSLHPSQLVGKIISVLWRAGQKAPAAEAPKSGEAG